MGMGTRDEEVPANFGSKSFRTNIEMLRAEAAEKFHSAIEHTQLPSKSQVRKGGRLPHILLHLGKAEGSTCQKCT